MMNYPNVDIHIDGRWRSSMSKRTISIVNPATEEVIGAVAHANLSDLEEAVSAADKGYKVWRGIAPFERSKLMRKAAELLRARVDHISQIMTMEQGKVLAEARTEVMAAADVIEWSAEEGRRSYGRLIPGRLPGVRQMVVKEPVGPVAAFTPWNFPINQIARKLSAALAAGCSIVVRAPEETPASPAELIKAFVDAGMLAGVINLVYGTPAEISEYLISHPLIRKISFTGSTVVGKKLAALAGQHMKRVTMELGGHAPSIIFDDADVDAAAKIMVAAKYRIGGQVCISPTRFLVQEKVFDKFVKRFVEGAKAVKVGDGSDPTSTMGALANDRRVFAMENMISDAAACGGKIELGGARMGNKGYFFQPTVMTGVPTSARAMNDEPFGPLAMISPFATFEDAIEEANRLPYGLASYAFTSSNKTTTAVGAAIDAGMVAINSSAFGLPETPFLGVRDSGYGAENGIEGIEAYLATKFITQTGQ